MAAVQAGSAAAAELAQLPVLLCQQLLLVSAASV
jgi:hypothetical protein